MANEMTLEDARKYLQELFAKAGRPDGNYRTDREQLEYLSENGAQRFKRKALGLCGHTTIKTLDEVVQILVDTNITSTIYEARQTVPRMIQVSRMHDLGICRGD